ncbi:MAG: hypothetical protein GY856_55420, partial [bacterium]|nr:hypothetical protein [bacterium]
ELLDCRPIDLAELAAELELSNDNDLLPQTDKGKDPFKKDRDFELKGNDGIILPVGTYLFDSLKITSNSEMRLDGEVRILVLGEIDVGGDVHAGGNPFELRLWSAGSSVKVNSQSVVHGHLYAPDAAVKLAGGSTFGGSLFAGEVALDGGSQVRRMTDDEPPIVEITSPTDRELVEVCEIPVTGTAVDAVSAVTLTLNGEPVEVAAGGTFEALVSLWTAEPGRIVAEARDAAGNVATAEVLVEIVLPVLALTSPPSGALVGERIV